MLAAVDVGYGFSKGAAQNGRRSVIPSTIAGVTAARGLGQVFGKEARDGHEVQMSVAGQASAFTVGATSGQRSWAADAAERSGYAALVYASLRLLGARSPVHLALGLPLALWLQAPQRKGLRARFRGVAADISLDGDPPLAIAIENAWVYPQGAGALAWVMRSDPSLATKPAGLIDVGYKTTDYLLMRRVDGAVVPDEPACGSLDIGVGMVYERARQVLSERTGALLPEGAVEDALRNYDGSLYIRGALQDVRVIVAQQAAALATSIADQMRRLWTDRLDLLGAVLIGGGGGELVFEHLRGVHPLTSLVPDALHANALGFLEMARQATGASV